MQRGVEVRKERTKRAGQRKSCRAVERSALELDVLKSEPSAVTQRLQILADLFICESHIPRCGTRL